MSKLNKGLNILEKLNSLGFEAYFVGGMPRDYIMKIEPYHDIDITTSATIYDIKKIFQVVQSFDDFQSSVILFDEVYFEITTFRRDVKYLDHRHPITEKVNTLKEDLQRRDFTINAIALNKDLHVFDYFNGVDDIKRRMIKTIGSPLVRFDEDVLRILRACYFASKLDFDMDNDMIKAMIEQKKLLTFLSYDKINEELIKMINTKNNKGFEYINQLGLLEEFLIYKKVIQYIVENQLVLKNSDDFYILMTCLNEQIVPFNLPKQLIKKCHLCLKIPLNSFLYENLFNLDKTSVDFLIDFYSFYFKADEKKLHHYYNNMRVKKSRDIHIDFTYLKQIKKQILSEFIKKLAYKINNLELENDKIDILKYIEDENE